MYPYSASLTRYIFFISVIIFFTQELKAQKSVGIGTTSPDSNAILHLVSPDNNQGLLLPQLTRAQRISIPAQSPENDGLIVYDITENSFYYWKEDNWQRGLGDPVGGVNQTLSYDQASGILSLSGGSTVNLSALNQSALSVEVRSIAGLTSSNVQGVLEELKSQIDGASDDQTLSLTGNSLSLENGGNVDLSRFLDNTDNQTLSLTENTLSLANGGTVDLSTLSIGSDDQVLSLTGNNLALESGGNVDLSGFLDNTDNQALSLTGNTLSLANGGTVDLSTLSIGSDDQVLSLTGNNLALESGGNVDLSGFLDNTDNQALSLAGNTLSLANGGTVDLSTLSIGSDDQVLSLTGNNLALESGGNVDLSGFLDNTDNQALSLTGNTLSLANGGTVDLAPYLDNSDDQSLTLAGTTLSISEGNSVGLQNIRISDLAEPNTDLSIGNNKIINVGAPTNGSDAATKQYVDDNAGLTAVVTDITINGNGTAGNVLSLANNAVTTNKIADDAVTNAKISSVNPDKIGRAGAALNQVLKWNGSAWAPADDATSGTVSPGVVTSFASIGPGDFVSTRNDGPVVQSGLVIFDSDNSFATIGGANNTGDIIAPVHLPHNATLQSITIYYWDNQSSDITVNFNRKPFAGSDEAVLASNWTSSGSSAGVQSSTITSFANAVVDNENFVYRFVINLNSGTSVATEPTDAEHRIYGIKIQYTEPGSVVTGPGNFQTSFVGDDPPPVGDRFVGMLWVETDENRIRIWTGTAWNIVVQND